MQSKKLCVSLSLVSLSFSFSLSLVSVLVYFWMDLVLSHQLLPRWCIWITGLFFPSTLLSLHSTEISMYLSIPLYRDIHRDREIEHPRRRRSGTLMNNGSKSLLPFSSFASSSSLSPALSSLSVFFFLFFCFFFLVFFCPSRKKLKSQS